jgi:tripartite-type tricarboxylate transporter receptor subunit TctC
MDGSNRPGRGRAATAFAALVAASLALSAGCAVAEDVAGFYKGKRMTILVGFSAGGGYGAYARLMANHFGRWVIAPPGLPKERTDALRKSFDAMVADPAFVTAATGQRLEIIPKTGAYIEALVKKTVASDPKMVARVRQVLGY